MDLSKKDKFKGRCIITGLYIISAIFLSGCATPKNIFVKNIILKEDKPSLAEDIIIDKAETPFRVGEELNYEVRWLGVQVGAVVAKIKGTEDIGGNEAYIVELKAKTNDFLSKIYPINDTFTSYIDKKKFVSLKHVVSRREGRYKKDAVTIFDYKVNKAYFSNMLDGSKKVFDIPGYVQDSLSAPYYFRTLDVRLGERVEYKVVNNEEIYDIIGVIERKAFIKTNDKIYETFYVEPYAKLKGERVRKGMASCYFSSDPLRIPIYGIVKAPLFTKVTAVFVGKPGHSLEDGPVKEGGRDD